jgi:hypothetical protein
VIPAVDSYRPQIEAALSKGGGTHSFDDVAAMIEDGRAQFWPGPRSVIITQIIDYPRKKVIHVFLAGGVMAEIQKMTPVIEEWAKAQGCSGATIIGRAGWQRSFLTHLGWKSTAVLMEKSWHTQA